MNAVKSADCHQLLHQCTNGSKQYIHTVNIREHALLLLLLLLLCQGPQMAAMSGKSMLRPCGDSSV